MTPELIQESYKPFRELLVKALGDGPRPLKRLSREDESLILATDLEIRRRRFP